MPTYVGTLGDDTENNNTDDVFYGLDGNDELTSGFDGPTYMYGGQGEDTINYLDAATGAGDKYVRHCAALAAEAERENPRLKVPL